MQLEASESPATAEPADQAQTSLILILRISAFLCLAGWTWSHLYWEVSYGVLLWHDSAYEWATYFGISWDEFVGSGAGDGWIQRWVSRIGWVYLVCTILTLTVGRRSYWQMGVILIGSVFLALLSYVKYVEALNQLPMLLEHGGQVLAPVSLVLALLLGPGHRATVATAIIAVVATFAGHGAYAIGWWPTPANFYAMVTVIFGLEYDTVVTMLRCAGVLDFLVCLLLFVPPLRRASAGYAFVWGLLTALARPVAGMSLSLNYWGADQFIHETVLRAPHFLIPLYLLMLWSQPCSPGDTHDAES